MNYSKIKKKKRSLEFFNIFLELTFVLINIYIINFFYTYTPDVIIFVLIIFLVLNVLILIFRTEFSNYINTEYDWITFGIFWTYLSIVIFLATYSSRNLDYSFHLIVFLCLYYRLYDLVYYFSVTEIDNKILFFLFVGILITITYMTEGIYNFLLAFITCIIGMIDFNSMEKLFNITIKEGYEFDEAKFIRNKLAIMKMLLVVYPVMLIGDLFMNNLSMFTVLTIEDTYKTVVLVLDIYKIFFAVIFYVGISAILNDEKINKMINKSYVKPI